MMQSSTHQDSSIEVTSRGRCCHSLTKRAWLLMLVMVCLPMVTSVSPANAQLPQDVRDVFEGMLESLDKDLQAKFEKAIANDTDKVEFTAEEFLRFRSNPANPFEGLDRIDVRAGGGNVALKFELPSMRDRTLNPNERQSKAFLAQLQFPVSSVVPSTVRVYAGKRHVAMGAIVSSNGHVATKASEIEVRKNIRCQLPDGTFHVAKLLRTDVDNDLAILKIDATRLAAIQWSSTKPELGSFLLTPDHNGQLIAMGSYSVRPRSTVVGEQAFLGVQPIAVEGGVLVQDIQPDAASYQAGLRDGDVMTHFEEQLMKDVASLVQAIRKQRPGDKVKIRYRRNGKSLETVATLGGNKISGERAARFKMMNRLGAVPSRRDDNFPNVFQHDTPLFPEHCGGPIVDLEGNVIGLNIARRGRASSLALPAIYVKTLVDKLLRESVAQAN